MVKVKVDWHSKPASDHHKDVVLERFRRYLRSIGLHDETIKLYVGRVRAFLDFAASRDPDPVKADQYRNMLIDKGLSRSHLNNTCFGIKKYFEMNGMHWDFAVLRSNDAIPYYFSEEDVLAIFSAPISSTSLCSKLYSMAACVPPSYAN